MIDLSTNKALKQLLSAPKNTVTWSHWQYDHQGAADAHQLQKLNLLKCDNDKELFTLDILRLKAMEVMDEINVTPINYKEKYEQLIQEVLQQRESIKRLSEASTTNQQR